VVWPAMTHGEEGIRSGARACSVLIEMETIDSAVACAVAVSLDALAGRGEGANDLSALIKIVERLGPQ
jgi:hypothetical protein